MDKIEEEDTSILDVRKIQAISDMTLKKLKNTILTSCKLEDGLARMWWMPLNNQEKGFLFI